MEAGKWNIAGARLIWKTATAPSPITAEEIAASGIIIALGQHVWNDVSHGSTRAFYCGTPAPLYSGDHSGWVALVECIPGEPVKIERVIVEQ